MHFASYDAAFLKVIMQNALYQLYFYILKVTYLENLMTCKTFLDYINNGLMKQIPKYHFGGKFSFHENDIFNVFLKILMSLGNTLSNGIFSKLDFVKV